MQQGLYLASLTALFSRALGSRCIPDTSISVSEGSPSRAPVATIIQHSRPMMAAAAQTLTGRVYARHHRRAFVRKWTFPSINPSSVPDDNVGAPLRLCRCHFSFAHIEASLRAASRVA